MQTAITLLGGLGMFLYGMTVMGEGLQKAAGSKLKKIIEMLTSNVVMGVLVGTVVTGIIQSSSLQKAAGSKLKKIIEMLTSNVVMGVLVGTVVTGIIQSSSATTVMVVGFVNAGIMTLSQAIGVIMGANIGTTVTAQLVSFSLEDIAPIALGIGIIFYMFTSKEKTKQVAEILIGFGLLFTGMEFMKEAVAPLSELQSFRDALLFIEAISGKKYGFTTPTGENGEGKDEQEKIDIAMRVCADHLRAVAFSIADGQLPSNAKAGYVIRRILRRAVRYAYTFLGQKQAFMYKLVNVLVEQMGAAFPELPAQQELITRVMKEEEDSFLRTLEKGINLLNGDMDELKAHGETQLDGVSAFRLFDTYGFPLDLTELICRENGYTVDAAGFDEEMKKQKERARNAAAVENGDWEVLKEGDQNFVGYDYTEYECHILRYRKVTQKKNSFYELVLDNTPFYGEMGGQVGDKGVLVSENETIQVIDTKRENNQSIHIVKELPKDVNADFMACVDIENREGSAANHTATHLLDYCLKQVLGDHVEQKGSYVDKDTLRFDFSHFQKVTDEELRKVEHMVNEMIRADYPLDEHRDTPIEEAKELGAIALFGEKYGDKVRVVRFGPSAEFCGGIHAKSTGKIGFFKIISESSVAAGIRRIEALTGKACEEAIYGLQDTIVALKGLFNNAKDLEGVIRKYIDEHDALKKDVEKFQAQAVERAKDKLVENAKEINGVKVVTAVLPMEPAAAKDLVFKVREALPENMICVVGSVYNDKPMLSVMFSDDMVKDHGLNAGKMIREAAKLIQGGGGGQPHYAQAGGKNKDGLSAAVDKVVELAQL